MANRIDRKRATVSSIDHSIRPSEVRTYADILSLKTDNHATKDGWLMVDAGKVIIINQRNGERTTGEVQFTRAQFNRLVRWYNHPQTISVKRLTRARADARQWDNARRAEFGAV